MGRKLQERGNIQAVVRLLLLYLSRSTMEVERNVWQENILGCAVCGWVQWLMGRGLCLLNRNVVLVTGSIINGPRGRDSTHVRVQFVKIQIYWKEKDEQYATGRTSIPWNQPQRGGLLQVQQTLSWLQGLALAPASSSIWVLTGFEGMEDTRLKVFWSLFPWLQRGTEARQHTAGSESLKMNSGRSPCKGVKMKPKLP